MWIKKIDLCATYELLIQILIQDISNKIKIRSYLFIEPTVSDGNIKLKNSERINETVKTAFEQFPEYLKYSQREQWFFSLLNMEPHVGPDVD